MYSLRRTLASSASSSSRRAFFTAKPTIPTTTTTPTAPSLRAISTKSRTGKINASESSMYGNEATRTSSHQEIVQEAPDAAFNPSITNPADEKRRAAQEDSKASSGRGNEHEGDFLGNPLEYSGANPDVSEGAPGSGRGRGDAEATGGEGAIGGKHGRGKERDEASGGSKRA